MRRLEHESEVARGDPLGLAFPTSGSWDATGRLTPRGNERVWPTRVERPTMRAMSWVPSQLARAVRSSVGALPAQFWFLWTGILINRLGTFVFPLLALYLTQRRGFTGQQVGFTIALYGTGNVIGGQVGGWLA